MNQTTSLSTARPRSAAHEARPGREQARLHRWFATAVLGALCVSLAGCGGGSSSSAGNGASSTADTANSAPAGAGGASAPVAIVAAPASGACATSGTSAAQPLLNTQLVCAP